MGLLALLTAHKDTNTLETIFASIGMDRDIAGLAIVSEPEKSDFATLKRLAKSIDGRTSSIGRSTLNDGAMNAVPTPFPSDFDRDLGADLKVCDAATEGPWHHDPLYLYACVTSQPMGCGLAFFQAFTGYVHCERVDFVANAAFVAAARVGWPASIRRAIAAETEVKLLADIGDEAAAVMHEADRVRAENVCLRAEVASLQGIVDSLAARCAGQSEALARRAEKSV